MKFTKNQRYFTMGVYLFGVIAASMVFYFMLQNIPVIRDTIYQIFSLAAPIIYGFALAYLLNPIMVFLDQRLPRFKNKKKTPSKAHRALSLLITYIIFLALVAIFIYLVLPQLAQSLYGILNNIGTYISQIRDFINGPVTEWLTKFGVEAEAISSFVDQYLNSISGWSKYADLLLPYIYNATMIVTVSIKNIVLALIISIYLLLEKERFCAQSRKVVYAALPKHISDKVIDLVHLIDRCFGGFILGKIIDSLIIGVLCYIGMCILQMPFSLLISVLVGVTNVIPYFGPFLGAIPSIIILFLVSPIQALVFGVFILILQQFDGNILGPKILGDSIGLSPFWIIFAVVLGGGYFGVLGMFLGVPLFAVIYTLVKDAVEKGLAKKGMELKTDAYMEGYIPPDPPPTNPFQE